MTTRVLMVQHTIYPYRLPLFARLSALVDLTVCFVTDRTPDRLWDLPSLAELPFEATVLDRFSLPLPVSPELVSLLRRRRFDVLVLSGLDRLTLVPALLLTRTAKSRGTGLVLFDEFFETSWYRRQRLKTIVNRQVRHLLYPHFDAFAVFNQPARRYLLGHHVSPDRIFVGPHWYPLPEPSPHGKEAGIDRWPSLSGKRVILCLSYLSERKGVDILISAFRSMPERDLALVIAGEGSDRQRLITIANGDSRVLFVGHVEGLMKDALYQLADVFVLPTLHDPWGLVVNEAMSYGLPVVTTTAAGSSEDLIKGFDTGVVVPPADAVALKAALHRLLADSGLRSGMGLRAKQRIQALGVDDMVEPLIAAIRAASTT